MAASYGDLESMTSTYPMPIDRRTNAAGTMVSNLGNLAKPLASAGASIIGGRDTSGTIGSIGLAGSQAMTSGAPDLSGKATLGKSWKASSSAANKVKTVAALAKKKSGKKTVESKKKST